MEFSPTKAQLIAPVLLRYAMAAVILWFALQQFIMPSGWFAYIPQGIVALTGWSQRAIIFLNASFELLFGVLLLVGKYTRIVAFLLALHLLDIMWVLGYGEVAVRDFGLAMGLVTVGMYGPDVLANDSMKVKKIVSESDITNPSFN
ncbi:MAG TPA: DoxX family membrane protein [Candidatus Paceibacterota bacterium]|nr:DoxX family membrane protein [Candidatus Paceibacterota bacterium]